MIDLENLSLTELKQLKCEINKIESKKKALNRENIDYENLPEMKPIIGFENLYSITKDGRVYSHIRNKFLKLKYNSKGYLSVGLYKDKKNYNKRVNRLVAEAYIPNPNGYKQVNHINYKRDDNRVENLEWCDNVYNSCLSVGRRKEYRIPKTGEKHITKQGNFYLVRLYKGGYESKAFKTLEEAVEYRDKRILDREGVNEKYPTLQ
jgi:hypothetical protein